MQNKELKKELIEKGIFKEYREKSYELYKELNDYEKKDEELIKLYGELNAKALKQLLNCRKKQKEKVLNQLLFYQNRIEYGVHFITFTFTDEVMNTTTPEERKRRVVRALQHYTDFSLNIDYGKRTEREHYHAIAYYEKERLPWILKIIGKEKHKINDGEKEKYITVLKIEDTALNNYEKNTGNIAIEEVKNKEKDNKKISYYLSKITLHSIKVKQKYISTRKGSPYQVFKDELNRYNRIRKNGSNFSYIEKGFTFPTLFPDAYKAYKEELELSKMRIKPDFTEEELYFSQHIQD